MTRVLVVDDVRPMAEQYAYDLARVGGFDAVVAEGGAAALDAMAREPVDCLVLDLEMPGMDGFGVMSQLHARLVVIPVILITAPVTEALRARARDAGMFQVLEKPLLGGALQDNIRQALGA